MALVCASPAAAHEISGSWRGCSESNWELLVAKYAPPEPVMINVGANKGYLAAAFLNLFGEEYVTPHRWLAKIRQYAQEKHLGYLKFDPCGACHECRKKPNAGKRRNISARGGQVHLLELMPSTRALLHYLRQAFHLERSITIHEMAASNETKVVPAPDAFYTHLSGQESSSLRSTGYIQRRVKKSHRQLPRWLNLTTVDDLMDQHGLQNVYQVLIDTEGWEPLVLEGMRRALMAHRIMFIEFEFNHKTWPRSAPAGERRSLGGTIGWMHDLGYECFMIAGQRGTWPISGSCWNSTYNKHGWSNVLCTHHSGAIELLQVAGRKPFDM
jgi:FkbM family methyltransferase